MVQMRRPQRLKKTRTRSLARLWVEIQTTGTPTLSSRWPGFCQHVAVAWPKLGFGGNVWTVTKISKLLSRSWRKSLASTTSCRRCGWQTFWLTWCKSKTTKDYWSTNPRSTRSKPCARPKSLKTKTRLAARSMMTKRKRIWMQPISRNHCWQRTKGRLKAFSSSLNRTGAKPTALLWSLSPALMRQRCVKTLASTRTSTPIATTMTPTKALVMTMQSTSAILYCKLITIMFDAYYFLQLAKINKN